MMDKNINDNDELHSFTCDKPLHEGAIGSLDYQGPGLWELWHNGP